MYRKEACNEKGLSHEVKSWGIRTEVCRGENWYGRKSGIKRVF